MSANIRSRALALLALTGLLQLTGAVRVSVEDDNDLRASSQQDPVETCAETLQTVFKTMTYRDLFSPLLDGAYRIRNRFSGEYLTANGDGFVATTLYHIHSSGMSDWKVKRVSVAGTPVFTVQNRKTSQYLVADGTGVKTTKSVDASGQWSLWLASDGVHRIVGSPSSGSLTLASLPSDLLELGERSDTEDTLETLLRGEWQMEWMPSWWRIPRSNTWGYETQWKVAANMPIIPGTEYTWLDFCDEDGLPDCAAYYAESRSLYLAEGLMSETTRRYVTQNKLSGSCDTTWGLMKFMFKQSAYVVQDVRSAAGKECAAKTIHEVSEDMETAIMAECFNDCLTSIREVIATQPCAVPENATALFETILSHGMCSVSDSALEALTDFALGEKCLNFTSPRPLWTAELHGVGSLTVADGNSVCAVPGGKESSRDSADLVMNRANGVCISGTVCSCPGGIFEESESTLSLQTGRDLFVTGGSSVQANLNSAFASGLRGVAIRTIVFGTSVTTAIVTLPLSITFIPFQIYNWGKLLVESLQWRCTQTAGCWPAKADLTKTDGNTKACRYPAATKDGGSLVWFMPPPEVKVNIKKWYELGRRCELNSCSDEEIMAEKIGFFGQEIYNCQRLPYEDMTATLQEKYLAKLHETLPAEYADEI